MHPSHRPLSRLLICAIAASVAACALRSAPMPPAAGAGGTHPLSILSSPAAKIYVTNANASTVTEFAKSANGNIMPLRTIQGSNTRIHDPVGIAVDSSGYIYVVNVANSPSEIDVYRPNANGNATPVRRIAPSGSNPSLISARGLAVDSANNLYVADGGPGVVEYAAGASGNPKPIAIITGSNVVCTSPTGVDLDTSNRIWVVNSGAICEYAAGANGNKTPLRSITGAATQLFQASDVKVSPTSHAIFATDDWPNLDILRFASTAKGNVAPQAMVAPPTAVPTPFPVSIALLGGDMYVGVGSQMSTLDDAIAVYPQTANGTPPPTRLIQGNLTGLNQVNYIAIH